MGIAITIVPWIFSLLSLIVAIATIYHNAKLHYFDVYFNQKVESYRRFMQNACESIGKTKNMGDVMATFYEVALFCSPDTVRKMERVVKRLAEVDDTNENPLDLITELSKAMKNDLEKDRPNHASWPKFQGKN